MQAKYLSPREGEFDLMHFVMHSQNTYEQELESWYVGPDTNENLF